MHSVCKACKTKDEEAIEEAYGDLKFLETELNDKRFFGGESIGLVDIVADFVGFWLGVIQEVPKDGLISENLVYELKNVKFFNILLVFLEGKDVNSIGSRSFGGFDL
ncbi:hypothetical protein RJ639_009686 [Escallonia herrerae]|uniref:Glutathione S-transferase C-terminal domain-containing protein n=1 Tax=Escallonia herrerae TaxID=1293975 RepID=A0AA89ARP9_9ASTE|nr:hypothetical protein RJ639_009686 [Escallonia herrerae]